MIAIIDYGMGNLRSVFNAITYLGYPSKICNQPDEMADATHIILPGVGSFHRAAINLNKAGFNQALHQAFTHSKPILGICLGMQLLASWGLEHGTSEGLNLVPGKVDRLQTRDHRLPHMGWNQVHWEKTHPVLEGIKSDLDLYFVHSYQFIPSNIDHTLGMTYYDGRFVAAISHLNILGFQFHPEKSQDTGLKLLDHFCQWDGLC